MKNSLTHLPQEKADELELIAMKIRSLCDDVHMVVLFGSYARGDYKDGPHSQGRGRLIIHKRSDYDILVLTANEYSARDLSLWDKVKEKLAQCDLSTHVRIIPRDIEFVNYSLQQGQYFFTEICEQGIILYNSSRFKLEKKQQLNPAEQNKSHKPISMNHSQAQQNFTLISIMPLKEEAIKTQHFIFIKPSNLHPRPSYWSSAVSLPQEHHLDILGDLAADYCPELKGLLPRETAEQKELFELLDYAYIGARYDREYKITKEQLEQLVPCVKKLHEVTEKVCKEKTQILI